MSDQDEYLFAIDTHGTQDTYDGLLFQCERCKRDIPLLMVNRDGGHTCDCGKHYERVFVEVQDA